jgi:SAM-dependent methyltransferase
MARAVDPAPTQVGPAAYEAWRRTPLGVLTERREHELLFAIAGRLSGLHVLDVGVGDGVFAVEAARRGAVVTGVDPDPAMLAAAVARARSMGAALHLGGGRVERLPFADGAFDLVFAVTVLCFVADADAAIREMARVLRPGGRLVVGDLNRWSSWAAIRYIKGLAGSRTWRSAHFRTAAQLRRSMAAAGLAVASAEGAAFHPPVAAVARLSAPWDRWLGRTTTFGAAFVAVAAVKPGPATSR